MSETLRNQAREIVQAMSRSRNSNSTPRRGFLNPELEALGRKNDEQLAMDRFLAIKLERESLPEDTPLPIYLAYREPRTPSPPSVWDKKEPKKSKILSNFVFLESKVTETLILLEFS